jgi:integrase
MPSLHKRTNSPFWFCSYQAQDGRWLKKSTKQRIHKKAMQICVEWERAARSAAEKNLTAAQARKVLADMVQFSTGESLTTYTLEKWIEEWLKNKAGGAREGTMVRYRQVTRDFLEHLGGRAKLSLAAITAGDIVGFRDKLRAEGRAVSTSNMVVKKILSVPFEQARRLGYIPTNPTHGVDLLKDRAEARKGAKESFTPAELAALLEAAEGDWEGAILIAATTGLRLGDIAALTWAQVDLKDRLIRFEDTQKTHTDVTLPLHPDLFEWLSKQPLGIGKAAVLPNLHGRKIGGTTGLSRQFRAVMEKAGVAGKVAEAKGAAGRNRSTKTFHSLRHTFVSALANAGIHPDIRQKLAGHADARVHQGYTHHEIETLRQAVEKLPTLRASANAKP